MLQRYVPNSFPLPHEVFELGLSPGPLLVYISLVYLKSMGHGADALSCSTISKLVGLCAKSVRTHLHALEDAGLIQIENSGGKFTYTLCPIRDMVEKQRAAVPVRARKVSWRSKTQTWITGEVFANVFPLPNDVFRLGLKAGNLLVYIYLLYCKNMKSDECWPSYSTIGKAVGMTKKALETVRTAGRCDLPGVTCDPGVYPAFSFVPVNWAPGLPLPCPTSAYSRGNGAVCPCRA